MNINAIETKTIRKKIKMKKKTNEIKKTTFHRQMISK